MRKRRRALSVPIWSKPDRVLTPRQRAQKARFLRALSLARRGREALEENLSAQGIDLGQVPKKTDAVKKVRGKLLPRTRDRIPRSLKFYEKGKLVHAEVANSQVASDIGRYWNTIAELTETGKSRPLRTLRRRRFKDLKGHFHMLEKNPKIILELEARRPKRELSEIYQR